MEGEILPKRSKKKPLKFASIIFLFCVFLYIFFLPGALKFSEPKIVVIKKGDGLSVISNKLQEQKIIYSKIIFKGVNKILSNQNKLKSGTYLFERRPSFFSLIKRLKTGDFRMPLVKIVIPEGFTTVQIAERLEDYFPEFNKQEFLHLTIEKEGYLFPDTYYLSSNLATEEILSILEERFKEIEKKLFTGKGLNVEDRKKIIIIASLVQKEVIKKEDMEEVAEIILKRISIGMPIQIDATLAYATGKNSFTLTKADLLDNHLYNSYTNKGLPPTPISNPGEDALSATIEAFISKKTTPYLYFLTDKDNIVRYGKTFEEHKANRVKYLNK